MKTFIFLLISLLVFSSCSSDLGNLSAIIQKRTIEFGGLKYQSVSLNKNTLTVKINDTSKYSNPINEQERIEYIFQDIGKYRSIKYDTLSFILLMPNRDAGNLIYKFDKEYLISKQKIYNDENHANLIQFIVKENVKKPEQRILEAMNIDFAKIIYGDNFIKKAFFGFNSFNIINDFLDETENSSPNQGTQVINVFLNDPRYKKDNLITVKQAIVNAYQKIISKRNKAS